MSRMLHDFLPVARSLSVSLTDMPPNSHSLECRPRHGSLAILPVGSRCGLAMATLAGGVGDFGRGREAAPRERLRERSRRRWVMAPKNGVSVEEALVREEDGVSEVVEVVGESWLEAVEVWEKAVLVRRGGGIGWVGAPMLMAVRGVSWIEPVSADGRVLESYAVCTGSLRGWIRRCSW